MKRVKVGGVGYAIKFSDDPRTVDPDSTTAAQSLDGCVNYQLYVLGLYSKEPPVVIKQTFFHELAHIIVKTYHITSVTDEDGKHNEAAMDAFGMGLQEALDSLGIDILEKIKDGKK